ncbi:hypothetical protein IU474_06050 [Nocardia otitidiscaviarum]|uniref:hypothetical protein n=1 Tax=Nocardia otitidiscaviarum TaxID=1823 RepID=UPI001895CA88|nr:hypothetical protein [Nocardia otitidiscaviarum]MBF6236640.1 hypothetical protein [Nocardia otitidiscaviarum]
MTIRFSPRDMVVLTILAEMYGAPFDLVAYMLGVSRSRAYRIVARWQKANMISANRVRPVPGSMWVYPTKSACEALLDRKVRHWVPKPQMAAHTLAVLQLRLALTGLDLDRWISERALRAEVGMVAAGQARPHIHDGRYLTGGGDLWAVEVELTAKSIAAARTAVRQARHVAQQADCAGLTYYCRGDAVKNVIREAAKGLDLSTGPKLRLMDLDEFLAAKQAESSSPATRPGLRVIAGGAADHDTTRDTNRDNGKAVGS